MRISDWSSDVCSSDLTAQGKPQGIPAGSDPSDPACRPNRFQGLPPEWILTLDRAGTLSIFSAIPCDASQGAATPAHGMTTGTRDSLTSSRPHTDPHSRSRLLRLWVGPTPQINALIRSFKLSTTP